MRLLSASQFAINLATLSGSAVLGMLIFKHTVLPTLLTLRATVRRLVTWSSHRHIPRGRGTIHPSSRNAGKGKFVPGDGRGHLRVMLPVWLGRAIVIASVRSI